MQKISNDKDGSMGSGVEGEMLEDVDSEFDDDIGIGTEDFELKGKEVACKLNMPSNNYAFEDNSIDNRNVINPSDGESKKNDNNCMDTAIVS